MRFGLFESTALLSTLAIFVGTLVFLEIGRRSGTRHLSGNEEVEGTGTIDAALFGLLGLLLAFTFSGAAARFDDRRQLIIEEANDIGTAYLRLDLLPAESQAAIREKFKQYLDSRIETYRKIPDLEAVDAELKHSQQLQRDIWSMSVAASKNSDTTVAGIVLLPALNSMIDITTTRTMYTQLHPPMVVFVMLAVILLASALLAGFAMGRSKMRSWLHITVFAVTLAVTFYVILDMEFPRMGLIRVDSFDQALVDLRNTM